ncbi:GL14662 [Drosophila persimilis]|uniref:GL14662 n=1 Tax=Drosophila persimilis TaxID=7234 RepID=B4GVJ6_DROPE|nr:GL14662 [Drosophila persimilis]
MFQQKQVKDWEVTPRRTTALNLGNTKIAEQLEAFKKHTAEVEKANGQCCKKFIRLKNKDRLVDVAMIHIESSRSTIVNVDGVRFLCHDAVLSFFSKRLTEQMRKGCLYFETPELASRAFDKIYRWMHGECSVVQSFDLAMLRGARFLAIPELLEQMWKLLEKKNPTEYDAFEMLCKSRKVHEIEELHGMMVDRITKSTLVIFSSKQFLRLSETQVSLLLKSDRLAVNSEIEWLVLAAIQVARRRGSVGKVLNSVRYGFLSILMLQKVSLADRPQTGPFGDILDVFLQLPESKKILADALIYSSLLATTVMEPHCLKDRLATTGIQLLSSRRWMIDTRCEYHRPVSATIPNMSFVSWDEFKNYMFMLQTEKTNIEDFRCVDELKRHICPGSESDPSVAELEPYGSTSSQTSLLSEDTDHGSTTIVASSFKDSSSASESVLTYTEDTEGSFSDE